MSKFNFKTMLWEWGDLGLNDVLAAMCVKYDKKEFEDFYWELWKLNKGNYRFCNKVHYIASFRLL